MKAKLVWAAMIGLYVAFAEAAPNENSDSGTPQPSVDLQRVQEAVFVPFCARCHSGVWAPRRLRLNAPNSYALLVGARSAEVPALQRVQAGDPDASYLVQKIEGRASAGARMPLGGPPLSQDLIDLVRDWIEQGAPSGAAERNAADDAKLALRTRQVSR